LLEEFHVFRRLASLHNLSADAPHIEMCNIADSDLQTS